MNKLVQQLLGVLFAIAVMAFCLSQIFSKLISTETSSDVATLETEATFLDKAYHKELAQQSLTPNEQKNLDSIIRRLPFYPELPPNTAPSKDMITATRISNLEKRISNLEMPKNPFDFWIMVYGIVTWIASNFLQPFARHYGEKFVEAFRKKCE